MQSRWTLARAPPLQLTPAQTVTLQDFADLYVSHIDAEEQIACPSRNSFPTALYPFTLS